MTIERNLILVHQPDRQDPRDFFEIAALVEEMAPDIAAFVVYNSALNTLTRKKAATLPTLIVSPGELDIFRPARGKIYAGKFIPKSEQMKRFSEANLPVPATMKWDGKSSLDSLGELILLKPDVETASLGKGISLLWRNELERNQGVASSISGREVTLQTYIHTGAYPVSYRVHTLFGEPLLAYKKTSTVRGPDPAAAGIDLTGVVFQPRRPTGQTMEICREADVLALARRAYAAMPDIPLHGCDIVREAKTGQLYILEINAGGNTWIFSSDGRDGVYVSAVRKGLGLNDLTEPFSAFQTAAAALIAKTREKAV